MNFTAFNTWYAQLTPRDRRVLRFGTIAVVIIIAAAILLPLQRNLAQAREQLQQQQQDLEWMKRQAPVLQQAGPGSAAAASSSRDSLVVLVDRTARESGLTRAFSGSQMTGNGAQRVQFTNADFNLLLGWLQRLSAQQGVKIDDASFTGTGNPGLVNASVQLRPGK